MIFSSTPMLVQIAQQFAQPGRMVQQRQESLGHGRRDLVRNAGDVVLMASPVAWAIALVVAIGEVGQSQDLRQIGSHKFQASRIDRDEIAAHAEVVLERWL